ncbi:MAG: hypothetical protein AABY11_02745 [archaeon]
MTLYPSIGIVSCSSRDDALARREFVWPLQRSISFPSSIIPLKKLSLSKAKKFDALIFSGTSLADNDFLSHAKNLSWITSLDIPLIGVCAGHELLGKIFGGKITHSASPAIGLLPVSLNVRAFHLNGLSGNFPSKISAYHLNQNTVSLPKGFVSLAKSSKNAHEITLHSQKRILSFQFHPEFNHSFLLDWSLNSLLRTE